MRSRELVRELWDRDVPPAISVQVLQELYVNLIRLGTNPVKASELIEDYGAWEVVENRYDLLKSGIAISNRWMISFWDGLIIAAAKRAHAKVIWSEDFNTNQDFDGVVVENPLIP